MNFAGPDSAAFVAEQASRWRAEVIADFRLRGAERCAAASPTPGFPQILESFLTKFDDVPDGAWVDLGGGLGGASSWIDRTRNRAVSLFDPSLSGLCAARSLFSELGASCADLRHLPIRDSSVAVAIANDVAAHLEEPDRFLAEAARILTDGGHLAVTGLWSPERYGTDIGLDRFASLEEFNERAARQGLDLAHVAVADPAHGWWSTAAAQVNDEIGLRYREKRGFDEWQRNYRRLRHVLDNDLLLAAGVVLVKRAPVAQPQPITS